jgi:hypothetical protein
VIWPGDLDDYRAGGFAFLGLSPMAAWFAAAAWPGSSWSARSRAAARTNELEAGERRPIIGAGERSCSGRRVSRVCVAGGVVSPAPMRCRACGSRLP